METIEELKARIKELEENQEARRMSFVQEIVQTLVCRGHYVPKNWQKNTSDVIHAVAIALERKV